MKQFFKFMLASMTGYLLLWIVMGFIFFSIIASIASFAKKTTVVIDNNSVLTLKLDQPIPDRTSDNPLGDFDFASMQSKKAQGLDNLLSVIKRAGEDSKIKGIFLDLSDIPSGIATIEEVRNALLDFKKSNNVIYVYSEDY